MPAGRCAKRKYNYTAVTIACLNFAYSIKFHAEFMFGQHGSPRTSLKLRPNGFKACILVGLDTGVFGFAFRAINSA